MRRNILPTRKYREKIGKEVKSTQSRITEYLRKLKEKRGCTQQEISDATGIPTGTLGKYFSGIDDDSASFETVRKIVVYLGGSLDELAGINLPEVAVDERRLTADGYTETEIRAIMRWAGSEISRTYKAVVAALEARITEKDERLNHRDNLIVEERRRASEAIMHERKRTRNATIISYVSLGLIALLFIVDFMMPTVGWIQR